MGNAREKINSAVLNGALLVGFCIGVATESLMVGGAVVAIILGTSVYSGDIRLKPTRRR